MAFFNKKESKDKEYVFGLKIGSEFEFEQKIWTVKKHFEYNWGDYTSSEFEVECFGEIAFLEVELDDEMYMTFTKEIDFETLGHDFVERITNDETPEYLKYNNKKFEFDEESDGVCTDNKTGEKEELICIDYYDQDDIYLISIEQWGENDYSASYGRNVNEHEFDFNNNSDTGNRFA